MRKSVDRIPRFCALLLIFLVLLAGCNLPEPVSHPFAGTRNGEIALLQDTTIIFRVKVDQAIPAGESIYISLLDEVTGLAFNPKKFILQAEDAQTYSVSLPLKIGQVVKYRYSREGTSIVNEHLFNDRPVRYRLYQVEGPGIVNDIISRWTDTQYLGTTGRIMGRVLDASTGAPVPNILVTAAGEQTFSMWDGTFLLEGLPPGTHNLVF
ncbi:MAG: carboxypeptidase-like regulatory domain-containing protein, partial [Acidobacteriaceae bacterium]